MTWEERLLFLMFLDYKGALEKWERNHNKQTSGSKIDSESFSPYGGFVWRLSAEGRDYWSNLVTQWNRLNSITVSSLEYSIDNLLFSDTIKVGYQTITKKDALKIADFIYECFGE